MQNFTAERTADTEDEIWLLEHPPVFTLGMAADRTHLLLPGDIPVVQTDRGGQVTYHGPGQLVIYPLVDVRRLNLNVRALVLLLEQVVIDYIARFGITGRGRRDAPGVYVDNAKLASLGLRIRRGATYHGLAFNVNMDLAPFSRINPCGIAGLTVTQLATLGGPASVQQVAEDVGPMFTTALGAARRAAA
ncbi:MAG: lipoyl(octanoyl) transferase LipB [Pseudomonadota bacterium]